MARFLILILFAFFLGGPATAQSDGDGGGFLEGLIEDALSGEGRDVSVTGFSGALSSQARLERMTISDADGVWLVLENAELDWTRSALLRGSLEIETLRASRLDILRAPRPVEGVELPPAEATPFPFPELPVSVRIGTLAVDRLSLGSTLIGQPAVLGLKGSATVDGDRADIDVALERIDAGGQFEVALAYTDGDETIDLALAFDEPADGLIVNLLGVPDRPEFSLRVKGAGPINDLTTDIQLKTDGTDRLAGQVALSGTEAGGTSFVANLFGDVTALFAPQYRPFFGPEVRLGARGTRDADGALSLTELRLGAEMISLGGQVELNPDGWPLRLNLRGRIEHPEGKPVLLPLPGTQTRIGGATFGVIFDASSGDAIEARADLRALNRSDLAAEAVTLRLDGRLSVPLGAPASMDAQVNVEAQGLNLSGDELAAVVGDQTELSTRLIIRQEGSVSLETLRAIGAGYTLSGTTRMSDLGPDTRIDFDLAAEFDDISRFSGVAGRKIGGALSVTAKGQAKPLDGSFDATISGTANDLRTGDPSIDALSQGKSALNIVARRDTEGLTVEQFTFDNPALTAAANGTIASRNSRLDYEIRLDDVRRLTPDYSGPFSATGQLTRDGEGDWSTDTRIAAPYGARAQAAGVLTGPEAAIVLVASIPDVSPLVSELSGPVDLDATARRAGSDWTVTADASGAGGIVARLSGTVTDDGVPDLTASGSVPLALSEPFISPRSLVGTAEFDLSLQGGTDIAALAGRLEARNARFFDPSSGVALEGISADALLSNGAADLNLSGNGVNGGTVSANGRIVLSDTLDASLALSLKDMAVRDARLFDTRVTADLTLDGGLTGGAMVRGDVVLGETTILVQPSALGATGTIPEITHIQESAASRANRGRAGLIATPNSGSGQANAVYGLDVRLSIPNRLFVRGRGLEAEMGGALAFTGTTSAINSTGSIGLVRGRLDLLGKRFDLTEGRVGFQGGLDPNLRLVATGAITGGSASIVVEGSVSEPEVNFVSSPQAPEDEVIAQLFFGRSLAELSAFQTLQLASAVATLAGNSGSDIVGRLRQGLNLDDFDVVTGEDGSAAVRAGKYISENVYTDVTVGQDTGEVSLNLDLNPSLTVRGSVASDGNTGLGVFFERDY